VDDDGHALVVHDELERAHHAQHTCIGEHLELRHRLSGKQKEGGDHHHKVEPVPPAPQVGMLPECQAARDRLDEHLRCKEPRPAPHVERA
jgi:hypothetical protein